MTTFWSRRLSRGEVVGYLVFVAGFALLESRGGFRDPWVELAVFVMAAGAVIAGRSTQAAA
jgi:hypothetical protein